MKVFDQIVPSISVLSGNQVPGKRFDLLIGDVLRALKSTVTDALVYGVSLSRTEVSHCNEGGEERGYSDARMPPNPATRVVAAHRYVVVGGEDAR
jgi:hypothetical protein